MEVANALYVKLMNEFTSLSPNHEEEILLVVLSKKGCPEAASNDPINAGQKFDHIITYLSKQPISVMLAPIITLTYVI